MMGAKMTTAFRTRKNDLMQMKCYLFVLALTKMSSRCACYALERHCSVNILTAQRTVKATTTTIFCQNKVQASK